MLPQRFYLSQCLSVRSCSTQIQAAFAAHRLDILTVETEVLRRSSAAFSGSRRRRRRLFHCTLVVDTSSYATGAAGDGGGGGSSRGAPADAVDRIEQTLGGDFKVILHRPS
eukprot:SAG22_NODE_878_length_6715_cov_9.368652_6_plen_111_part_00